MKGYDHTHAPTNDTEGYSAAYRGGYWIIVNRFSVAVPKALTWPDYKAARKQADKMNAAVIAGRFKS